MRARAGISYSQPCYSNAVTNRVIGKETHRQHSSDRLGGPSKGGARLTRFLEEMHHENIQNPALVSHFADELSLHRVPGNSYCTVVGALNA